jgi:sugar lactone lactonase YvrE
MKKMYLTLCLLFPFFLFGQQYFVKTILDSTLKVDDALALDKAGNLYGSHYMGISVYKLTPQGDLSIFATGFNTPNGLAFNSREELYIVDNRGNRIYKVDKSGVFLDTISITNPSGIIKSHDSDTMIFTHYMGNHISKLAPDGSIIPWHSGGLLNGPVGLCYDDSSNLYVGNFTDREIYRVRETTLEYIATIPGPSSGSQRYLGFITYAKGWIYGTSFNLDRIYRVHPAYVDSVQWFTGNGRGSLDGHTSIARFNQPNGILASPTGDTLYVSDFGTGKIRRITPFTTAIDQEKDSFHISFFPNPVKNHLQLRSEKMLKNADFNLYDALGKILITRNGLNGNTFRFDLTNLPSGIYTLVISQNGYQSQKLIVRD